MVLQGILYCMEYWRTATSICFRLHHGFLGPCRIEQGGPCQYLHTGWVAGMLQSAMYQPRQYLDQGTTLRCSLTVMIIQNILHYRASPRCE
jgi:hypothetical protein